MAKVVKMCDLPAMIAATVFAELNEGHVKLKTNPITNDIYLESDVQPSELTYPEGWYFAKKHFRNKHKSTTGLYEEVPVYKDKTKNVWWEGPCTLDE